jgi:hypothetical protein
MNCAIIDFIIAVPFMGRLNSEKYRGFSQKAMGPTLLLHRHCRAYIPDKHYGIIRIGPLCSITS